MELQTIIFIGRSGCGKGTQAKLLQEYIAAHDTSLRKMFYVETGAKFRKFIDGESYSSKLASKINKEGGRQPDFLAVWVWGHLFVDEMQGNEHIIIDGAPRSLLEAQMLTTAFSFYKRSKPVVIHMDVSKEWSRKHLLDRARSDDHSEEIEKRLSWFETEVFPAIEYYRAQPEYEFFDINGERTIEEVQSDIIEKLNLL